MTGLASNSTTVVGFVQGINDNLMMGWMGTMLLISLIIIIYSTFYFTTQDVSRALAGASFISMVFAFLLKLMDLIPGLVLYITIILAAGTIAFTWKKN